MVVEQLGGGMPPGVGAAVTTQGDEHHRLTAGALPDGGGNRVAVQVRQPDVEDHHVWQLPGSGGQGLLTVARHLNPVAHVPQRLRGGGAGVGVVLHQQHPTRGRDGPGLRNRPGLGPFNPRQAHDKNAAAAETLAFGADFAAMQLHQLPDQRQPYAQPALQTPRRARALHKRLENLRQQVRCDAHAAVDHLDDGGGRQRKHPQLDVAAGSRKLQGIGDQVVDDLLDANRIGMHPDILCLHHQLATRRPLGHPQPVHTTGHTVGQVERLRL